ncbi:unnamed protein product [Owenia fusiformis]|uniref:Uncharacterized protein n=1 Tax=Owenia fusiformis TaxID=6347 RepID=A0A8J1UH82_OWEFU|nr:unnamed protein product [Owenia fusiformis]
MDLQDKILSSLSDDAKANVNRLLTAIHQLSDVEKLYLYMKLPSGAGESSSDALEKTSLGLTTRIEQADAFRWMQSNLEEDKSVSVPKQEVYDDYVSYCQDRNMKSIISADFGKIMKTAFPNVRNRRLGQRGQSQYCYSGVKKKVVLKTPTLPCIDLTMPSEGKQAPAPLEESEVDKATKECVCEWAQKLLSVKFESTSHLAEYLITKMYVNHRSKAAYTVISSLKEKKDPKAVSSTPPRVAPVTPNTHRETQLILHKALLERRRKQTPLATITSEQQGLQQQQQHMISQPSHQQNVKQQLSSPRHISQQTTTTTGNTLQQSSSSHSYIVSPRSANPGSKWEVLLAPKVDPELKDLPQPFSHSQIKLSPDIRSSMTHTKNKGPKKEWMSISSLARTKPSQDVEKPISLELKTASEINTKPEELRQPLNENERGKVLITKLPPIPYIDLTSNIPLKLDDIKSEDKTKIGKEKSESTEVSPGCVFNTSTEKMLSIRATNANVSNILPPATQSVPKPTAEQQSEKPTCVQSEKDLVYDSYLSRPSGAKGGILKPHETSAFVPVSKVQSGPLSPVLKVPTGKCTSGNSKMLSSVTGQTTISKSSEPIHSKILTKDPVVIQLQNSTAPSTEEDGLKKLKNTQKEEKIKLSEPTVSIVIAYPEPSPSNQLPAQAKTRKVTKSAAMQEQPKNYPKEDSMRLFQDSRPLRVLLREARSRRQYKSMTENEGTSQSIESSETGPNVRLSEITKQEEEPKGNANVENESIKSHDAEPKLNPKRTASPSAASQHKKQAVIQTTHEQPTTSVVTNDKENAAKLQSTKLNPDIFDSPTRRYLLSLNIGNASNVCANVQLDSTNKEVLTSEIMKQQKLMSEISDNTSIVANDGKPIAASLVSHGFSKEQMASTKPMTSYSQIKLNKTSIEQMENDALLEYLQSPSVPADLADITSTINMETDVHESESQTLTSIAMETPVSTVPLETKSSFDSSLDRFNLEYFYKQHVLDDKELKSLSAPGNILANLNESRTSGLGFDTSTVKVPLKPAVEDVILSRDQQTPSHHFRPVRTPLRQTSISDSYTSSQQSFEVTRLSNASESSTNQELGPYQPNFYQDTSLDGFQSQNVDYQGSMAHFLQRNTSTDQTDGLPQQLDTTLPQQPSQQNWSDLFQSNTADVQGHGDSQRPQSLSYDTQQTVRNITSPQITMNPIERHRTPLDHQFSVNQDLNYQPSPVEFQPDPSAIRSCNSTPHSILSCDVPTGGLAIGQSFNSPATLPSPGMSHHSRCGTPLSVQSFHDVLSPQVSMTSPLEPMMSPHMPLTSPHQMMMSPQMTNQSPSFQMMTANPSSHNPSLNPLNAQSQLHLQQSILSPQHGLPSPYSQQMHGDGVNSSMIQSQGMNINPYMKDPPDYQTAVQQMQQLKSNSDTPFFPPNKTIGPVRRTRSVGGQLKRVRHSSGSNPTQQFISQRVRHNSAQSAPAPLELSHQPIPQPHMEYGRGNLIQSQSNQQGQLQTAILQNMSGFSNKDPLQYTKIRPLQSPGESQSDAQNNNTSSKTPFNVQPPQRPTELQLNNPVQSTQQPPKQQFNNPSAYHRNPNLVRMLNNQPCPTQSMAQRAPQITQLLRGKLSSGHLDLRGLHPNAFITDKGNARRNLTEILESGQKPQKSKLE